jgi:hypothetical protein
MLTGTLTMQGVEVAPLVDEGRGPSVRSQCGSKRVTLCLVGNRTHDLLELGKGLEPLLHLNGSKDIRKPVHITG